MGLNVVARIIDGPASPLAIHFGAGVEEPPRELLFMEVPGHPEGHPHRWVRLEPEFAALEDPDARFEWYDLATEEPYAELDTNALWPYTWREGFKTIVLPRRQAEADEDVSTRVMRLREYLQERNPLGGAIDEETLRLRCDRCGTTHRLSFARMGIDWPEQLAGWGKGPEGDLCPECVAGS